MAKHNISVILGYGPQESEYAEVREEFFTEMEIEIEKCRTAGELPIVIGDMNSKLAPMNGHLKKPLTSNGRLLQQVIESQDLEVLNFSGKCNGQHTHVTRTTGASSTLDYVLISREMDCLVNEMLIDEECLMCPFWVEKVKGKDTPKFSDHNAIILRLSIPHEKNHEDKPALSWKITKEGLDKLAHVTSNDLDQSIQGGSIQECYNKFENKINKLMGDCFKVRRCRKSNEHIRKDLFEKYKQVTLFSRKGKAQRRVARKYITEIMKANTESAATAHKERLRETLTNLTIDDNFSPNKFWDLCKRNKVKSTLGSSVELEDGNEVYSEEMIRNAYKNEFVHRLRKREISPDLLNYEKQSERLCQLLLSQEDEHEPTFSPEELENVRKHLKKGKSPGRDGLPPDIFIHGGEKLQQLVMNMLNFIKQNKGVPKQWSQVQITTIYKNKGKKKQLVNQRGIFLKQVLSKMYGKLNMNRADTAMENIDKSQAGGRHNRGPADHTYLLRAAIDHSKYINQPLHITLYDYAQCFDSLWLSDSLLSLLKVGVSSEVVRNLKELNEKSNIVVKTPVGMTDEFEMASIVQQGSVSGGALCVVSTAEVSEEELGDGIQIGTASVKVLTYVDDIATITVHNGQTYVSHESVKWFSDKKRLDLQGKKCVVLSVNLRVGDVIPRLKIRDTVLENVKVATYLGDQFNATGTNSDLIRERVRKANGCIVNIMTLCSEVTMGMYTIQTTLLLYQTVFLPVVLYNAQAWSNLTNQNINDLQTVQLKLLKRMLHAPTSTSNPLTFLETGCIPIRSEIEIKQLCFLHHILSLEDGDPVKVTYRQQMQYPFEPNWGNTISTLRSKHNITESDTQIKSLSKDAWKQRIKSTVRANTLRDLKEAASQQKHSSNITLPNSMEKQDYLTSLPSQNARKIFHIRTGTIDLKHHRRYKYGNDTTCRLSHQEVEDVDHVVNRCEKIGRDYIVENIYTTNNDELLEVSKRCIIFDKMVDEQENLSVV